MVERIEVLYGGQGIFYGTQSVAGVVNVVTKPFSDSQEGRVGLAVDGNDGVHASLDYRGSAGGHQFVVYASSDEADGIRPYRSEDIQPSTTDRDRSYDITMLGLKYAYDIGETSRLSLHYQHTDAELDFARPYLNHDTFNARDEDIVTLKYDLQATDNIGLVRQGVLAYLGHRLHPDLQRPGRQRSHHGRLANRERWLVLGLRGLRADGHDAGRNRGWIRLCGGIRAPALFRQRRRPADRGPDGIGERVLRSDPDQREPPRQHADGARTPVQQAQWRRRGHRRQLQPATRFQRRILSSRQRRHVLPPARRLAALR